jgi:hypothetical protein
MKTKSIINFQNAPILLIFNVFFSFTHTNQEPYLFHFGDEHYCRNYGAIMRIFFFRGPT